ncbi:hypothetical protein ACFV1L_12725 [Kitasatospora sp. NPDC059646]|uniref:hypothetical protein n=1 Tax=Kitasatospora sp. NPDC059646 TaxID=3346893 RepID=UPI0036A41A2F
MPALPEHDFEDRLARVFHETGESFLPDTPRLAMGGAARGRRRQRRRLVLGSAVAVLAVTGLSAAVLPPVLRTETVGPAVSAPPPPSDAGLVPQEAHLVSAVAERLPKDLRVVRSAGSTLGAAAFPSATATAALTLDDGRGASLLTVDIYNTVGWGRSTPCASYPIQGVRCEETAEPDGTRVAVTEYTTPDPKPKKYAEVELNSPNGTRVTVASFNSATSSGDATRPEPVLTVAQLRALAADPGWRTFEAALSPGVPNISATGIRVQRPDLLPPGLKVVASSGGGPDQRATLTDGTRTVELQVQEEKADRAAQNWFAEAPALDDTTRIRRVDGRPVPGAQGATESIVDVLRLDGTRVRVTALNPAGAGSPEAGRPPLLTPDQLTAIALCPGWTVPPAVG